MALKMSVIIQFMISLLLFLSEVQGKPSSKHAARVANKFIQGRKLKDGKIDIYNSPHDTFRLLRANLDDRVIEPQPPPRPPQAQENCRAIVRTRDNGKKFFGANGAISLHKPSVNGNQWSSSRVKLLNGADSIEAGWMVNPNLFKDNEAHLYARFTAGGKECINTQCSGFVQVPSKGHLGLVPNHYGYPTQQQYTWNVSIEKHQDDGNWWLSIITEEKIPIGYWPKNQFTSLIDSASQVEWGGEIKDPGATNPPPSMGNGLRATYDTSMAAFAQHITIVDESFHSINPDNTEEFLDCPDLYTVLDFGYKGDYWGHTIVYGGVVPSS